MHAARAELASGELELPGHVAQAVASVAPTVVEYVAAAQSAQTALPVSILYFPATHTEQTPPSGPVNPTSQVHAARAELAKGELALPGHVRQVAASVAPTAVEYVAAAQSVHTALPVAILCLPAVHAEHTPPSGPVKPALHVQATVVEL